MIRVNNLTKVSILFCFTMFLSFTVSSNTRAYYENLFNLYQQAAMKRDYPKSIEYLTEMRTLAETNDWKDLQIEVLNDMGLLYTDIYDYNKAMDCYMKSYEIALQENNAKGKIIVLNNIGRQFSIEGNYNKSKEYVKAAYDMRSTYEISKRAELALATARQQRNELLYEPKTGMMDTALAVKDYVKAVFGAASPQYKEVKHIQFRNKKI